MEEKLKKDPIQKYEDEHHNLIIHNNLEQEKLIMKISGLVIGAVFGFSRLLETTPLHCMTKMGIYSFVLVIVIATTSYSIAQYVLRKSIVENRKYYQADGNYPYPDVSQFFSEKLRRFLDYSMAVVFCFALVVTSVGVIKQYERYHKGMERTDKR